MAKMRKYIQKGKEFYSLKEALQDMYICLMMEKALANPNEEVESKTQKWAKDSGQVY